MATIAPPEALATGPRTRRWTREEFQRAISLGLFRPDERLELIGGEVCEKMTMNSPHATGISLVEKALRALLPPGLYLRVQLPLALGRDSQPEPDIAIVSGDPRDYARQHPATAALVVEVAVASLPADRLVKNGLYAGAGIAEYWILNVEERLLEVYRDPVPAPGRPFGHHYRAITRYTEADTVAPLFAPAASISVADLLP